MSPDERAAATDAENDQAAMRANDHLDHLVRATRIRLALNGGHESRTLAMIATLLNEMEAIPRDTLASLLAVASMRLVRASDAERRYLCLSDFYADTGRRRSPGDREIRCGLTPRHGGSHDELINSVPGLSTWPAVGRPDG